MTQKILLLFIISILLFSCNASKDLIKENEILKAKIEALKVADTSKLEAVLEVSNLNIVYRGVRNPLRISFPNAVKINATGKGLTKKDEFGNYDMVPQSGRTVDIKVEAEMIDGAIISDVKTLKIKDIGKPIGTINGLGCGSPSELLLRKNQLKSAKIGTKINDFLFCKFHVHGFRIKIEKQKTIKIEGDQITKELNDILNATLNIGDIIQIFDIRISGCGARMKSPYPITIRIIE